MCRPKRCWTGFLATFASESDGPLPGSAQGAKEEYAWTSKSIRRGDFA